MTKLKRSVAFLVLALTLVGNMALPVAAAGCCDKGVPASASGTGSCGHRWNETYIHCWVHGDSRTRVYTCTGTSSPCR